MQGTPVGHAGSPLGPASPAALGPELFLSTPLLLRGGLLQPLALLEGGYVAAARVAGGKAAGLVRTAVVDAVMAPSSAIMAAGVEAMLFSSWALGCCSTAGLGCCSSWRKREGEQLASVEAGWP